MNAVKPTALCIISLLLLLSSEFLSAAKCELAVVSPTEIQVTMRGSTALTNDQERQAALDNFRYEKYILGEHLPFVEITSPGASSGNGTPFASRLFIAWKNAEVANAAKEGINQLLPGACQPILNSEMARLKQRAKNEFNDHSLATTDTVLRIKTQ
mgnify:FL=1